MPTRPRLAPAAPRRRAASRSKPRAVVAHRKRKPAARGEKAQPQVARPGVAQDVGDGLLRDAEARGLDLGADVRGRVRGVEVRQ